MNPSVRRSELPAAAAYLADVASQLQSLPAAERDELIADLRDHIDASGDEDLTDVLTRLGDPAGFAHTLGHVPPAPSDREHLPPPVPSSDREHVLSVLRVIAVILIVGSALGWLFASSGFLLTWIVGVIALWLLPPWRPRDHAVATLVGPISVAVIVLLRVRRWVTAIHCDVTVTSCSHPAPTPMLILGYVLLVAFVAVNLWVGVRLLWPAFRLRGLRRADASTRPSRDS